MATSLKGAIHTGRWPGLDLGSYSVSELLDLIRESRVPWRHVKAQDLTKGGYMTTREGYEEWVADVLLAVNHLRSRSLKAGQQCDDFLKRYQVNDPLGFEALKSGLYHETPIDISTTTTQAPPPTTTTLPPPPTTTTTLPPPPTTTTTTTTAPPPTTTEAPPPTTTTTLPPTTTTTIPVTTTTTPPPDDRSEEEEPDLRYGHEGGTRPHTAHGPFWPRVPADWPYASREQRRIAYEESGAGEDDLTLNMGPDDWGAPPGTRAALPPGDDISTGALQVGLPEEGPIPAIIGAIQGGIEEGVGTIKSIWDVVVKQEWPNTGLRPLDDFMNDYLTNDSGVRQG